MLPVAQAKFDALILKILLAKIESILVGMLCVFLFALSPDFPLLKAQCGKLIIFKGGDYLVLSIPDSREEFICMPDTKTYWKWCILLTLRPVVCVRPPFVYTAGNDSHFPSYGIEQRCSCRRNWGKFSWISEAVEGCLALGVKTLLEKLKWSIRDDQTPQYCS